MHLYTADDLKNTWLNKFQDDPYNYLKTYMESNTEPLLEVNFLNLLETIDEFNPDPIIYKSILQPENECTYGICSDFDTSKSDDIATANKLSSSNFDLSNLEFCQPFE